MPGPFRLRLFGGMQLLPPADAAADEVERAGLLENRRRMLAVLTVLAISPRPLTRDQLADFFWSNSEPARARHSVAESLRLLRRVLGDDAVAARSADITMDATAPLESDVARFLAAHAAGAHSTAAALYTADFLDGIYVDRAPRFDEWVDRQREALRQTFASSCAAECRRLAHHGDHAASATLARRWLDIAPLSFEAADAWFRALLAPGSNEALHVARERMATYAAHLAAEYDTAPDRRLTHMVDAAAQSLAARTTPPSDDAVPPVARLPLARPRDASAASPEGGPRDAAFDRRAVSPASESASASPSASASHAPSRARRAVAVGVLTVVVATLAMWRQGVFDTLLSRSASERPTVRIAMVVADAENATSDSLLGAAVSLAMSTALTTADEMRLIAPARVRQLRSLMAGPTDSTAARGPLTETVARAVATRAGAGTVAVPVLVSIGAQYRVALRVVRANDGGAIASVQSAVVTSAQLLRAIDDVVYRVRGELAGQRVAREPVRPLPDYTTASLQALRLFAQGTQSLDAKDYIEAIESFRSAVQVDSTFALAWTALGRVLTLANRPLDADSAYASALRHASHLTAREQMIVRAAALRARGLADSAIALRAQWIAAHPDDVEQMRAQVFELLTRSRRSEAVALGESLMRQDSTDENVLLNVAMAYDGDDLDTRHRAVAVFARALTLDTTQLRNPMLPQLYGGLLARAQMYDSASRFFDTFGPGNTRMYGRAMRARGQMEMLRQRPDAAITPFERAIAAGREMQDTLSWVRTRIWMASALYGVRDSARARAHTDTLVREAALLHEPQVQYWIGLHLSRLGRLADADAVLRALARTRVPTSRVHAADYALLAAEIAAARGQAKAVLPTLAQAMVNDSSAISVETLAWVALQAGDTVAARSHANTLFERSPGFGFEGWLARDRARVWLAQLGSESRR